ncbi:interleukin-1 receptor-associated kinase-like 2 [Platysternon megacephalum]|uniref:Interleukin-1 receptor-associated kinase-like 2 n=1 Tax=Platysternon megacephalum TaxID=55544 RepID=A0A4D9E922_9SAUR|nr:interleukin-1 receptor-associated kinase-like 2 [Platysternon megacephalum]
MENTAELGLWFQLMSEGHFSKWQPSHKAKGNSQSIWTQCERWFRDSRCEQGAFLNLVPPRLHFVLGLQIVGSLLVPFSTMFYTRQVAGGTSASQVPSPLWGEVISISHSQSPQHFHPILLHIIWTHCKTNFCHV